MAEAMDVDELPTPKAGPSKASASTQGYELPWVRVCTCSGLEGKATGKTILDLRPRCPICPSGVFWHMYCQKLKILWLFLARLRSIGPAKFMRLWETQRPWKGFR